MIWLHDSALQTWNRQLGQRRAAWHPPASLCEDNSAASLRKDWACRPFSWRTWTSVVEKRDFASSTIARSCLFRICEFAKINEYIINVLITLFILNVLIDFRLAVETFCWPSHPTQNQSSLQQCHGCMEWIEPVVPAVDSSLGTNGAIALAPALYYEDEGVRRRHSQAGWLHRAGNWALGCWTNQSCHQAPYEVGSKLVHWTEIKNIHPIPSKLLSGLSRCYWIWDG